MTGNYKTRILILYLPKMRNKLPAHMIFGFLPNKVIAKLNKIAKETGWDQPATGIRYYRARSMLRAIFLFYLKKRPSLDVFVAYLKDNGNARKACGFSKFSPSRDTLSRFMRTLGSRPFEIIFDDCVKLMFQVKMIRGRHIAIDSTFVTAWSRRKSGERKSPDFIIAKNCNFARVGHVRVTFDLGYRIQAATITQSTVPIAIDIIPGNMHDRRAFEAILEKSLKQMPNPLAISADKGYSSAKNRKLVKNSGAACFIRPSKTDLKCISMESYIPGRLSEETYWKVYWKRNAVELTFAYAKGQCSLNQPRVVNEDMVKQHVFISFIIQLFSIMASLEMGLNKSCFSIFY